MLTSQSTQKQPLYKRSEQHSLAYYELPIWTKNIALVQLILVCFSVGKIFKHSANVFSSSVLLTLKVLYSSHSKKFQF